MDNSVLLVGMQTNEFDSSKDEDTTTHQPRETKGKPSLTDGAFRISFLYFNLIYVHSKPTLSRRTEICLCKHSTFFL